VSDRSDQLRRQRDLLREHLAWLEREIAAESEAPRAAPTAWQPPSFTPPAPAPVDDRDAEAILAEYRTQPASITRSTKVGCILYFVVALVLMIGAVLAFYAFARSARGH
jgi:hypothetical protein